MTVVDGTVQLHRSMSILLRFLVGWICFFSAKWEAGELEVKP
jgi:hypothetical protein